jgi:prepilin-type N-terminal cleavage/methylation domain-containing protein
MSSITGTSTPSSKAAARRRIAVTAFTLLELILVMAIIAIIVGLAVPSLNGFAKGRRTTSCADQIVALTHYAHTQAITRATVFRLNLKPGSGNQPATYWLSVQQDDGTFGPTGDSMGLEFQAPDGVNITWNAPRQPDGDYIQFQPNGRTDPCTIQVLGADRQVILIACPSATELFKVMSPEEARSLGL